jgi:hypothetical protein
MSSAMPAVVTCVLHPGSSGAVLGVAIEMIANATFVFLFDFLE